MKKLRLGIMIFAALFSFAMLCYVAVIKTQIAEAQSGIVRLHKLRCHSVRVGLGMARDGLLNQNPEMRDWGLVQYKTFTRSDWVESNMCSEIHVGERCALDDLPCKLHALDWALVNVR